jgi:ribosomal protein S18 acetylase RimI-like enzyme
MNEPLKWRKCKEKDLSAAEKLLRDNENYCVTACGRFLSREPAHERAREHIWLLGEKARALIISSKSALLPVFCGINEIPAPEFLKGFLRFKRVHSIQGMLNDVMVLEKVLERTGRTAVDIIDYDLMGLDAPPSEKNISKSPASLVLRVPRMYDLDALAPLQAGYEKEEVLPKGSVFSPASSRVNIANIVARSPILAAELDGKLVGKINVSAVSFARYQVGGVYVRPDYRGRGIASCMAAEFIASLIKDGRGVTLFVKKNNIPAKKLYSGLGFTVKGDYRITYY